MVGSLLLRGMLVGIIAGLLAFGFARVFGEPQVDRAIAFEEQQAQAAGEAPEPELVSRATQAGLGLLTGILVYGASIGGLFALVFSYVQGRVSGFGPRGTAVLIALAGFVAIILVPEFKYPASPPSVGNPETIEARTGLFFVMLVMSVATAVASIGLAKRLMPQHGAWNAWIAGGTAYVVVMAVAHYALPPVNEVPEQFSAVVLWNFRVASLGIQAVLWTAIGLMFGAVAERKLVERRGRQSVVRAASH
ncbi:CbtA family protein [Mesorhizobium qingshengii]|uniref:CbtA family protein n=1 Tax=Mesorhizobium qingshengii TaxID=1165689 RepID=A0ABT4QQC3_9HYPH|nr:CbtA family protein [Mesorhizobium qingshengii]MCZ8543709.1 CbtA family protein [Mesorhizobium qingshengii]